MLRPRSLVTRVLLSSNKHCDACKACAAAAAARVMTKKTQVYTPAQHEWSLASDRCHSLVVFMSHGDAIQVVSVVLTHATIALCTRERERWRKRCTGTRQACVQRQQAGRIVLIGRRGSAGKGQQGRR